MGQNPHWGKTRERVLFIGSYVDGGRMVKYRQASTGLGVHKHDLHTELNQGTTGSEE